MHHLSDVELLAGREEAGVAECTECGKFFKIEDGGCDLCSEEEVEIAA